MTDTIGTLKSVLFAVVVFLFLSPSQLVAEELPTVEFKSRVLDACTNKPLKGVSVCVSFPEGEIGCAITNKRGRTNVQTVYPSVGGTAQFKAELTIGDRISTDALVFTPQTGDYSYFAVFRLPKDPKCSFN